MSFEMGCKKIKISDNNRIYIKSIFIMHSRVMISFYPTIPFKGSRTMSLIQLIDKMDSYRISSFAIKLRDITKRMTQRGNTDKSLVSAIKSLLTVPKETRDPLGVKLLEISNEL